ncbi:MAG: rhodanese-like domain-containing protein [Verrucomicrobiota bacterium]
MNAELAQDSNRIKVVDLQRVIQGGKDCELLDVRTVPEHEAAHVPNVKLVPLDALDPAAYLAKRADRTAPLYVFCQAGGRAQKAIDRFRAIGFHGCVLVEGGTQAWMDAGLPVIRGTTSVLPLMRQVQIVIGVVSGTGALLALTVNSKFALIPLVTGCGLLFAGVTGTCGLALLLAQMPWNKGGASKQSGPSCCG